MENAVVHVLIKNGEHLPCSMLTTVRRKEAKSWLTYKHTVKLKL